MRILLITNASPYPPISGFGIRVFNLLRRIAITNEVWLLTFGDYLEEGTDITPLTTLCKYVEFIPSSNYRVTDKPLEFFQYLIQGKPPELRLYHSKEMFNAIRRLTQQINFDVVQIEDSFMAMFVEAVSPDSRCKTVLTLHDVVYQKYDRIWRLETNLARKLRHWLFSQTMKTWEPNYVQRFDLCYTMSHSDKDTLLKNNPNLTNIEVLPNGVDTEALQPLNEDSPTPALVFVGNMGYTPNIDAMLFFCQKIYPIIREQVPDVELWIAGINTHESIKRLDNHERNIHVLGKIEDTRPLYQRSKVCVVPLRAGGGTRIKILEAMAYGKPVVSTSIGCEGLQVEDGKNILIADDSLSFAQKTVRLLTCRDERERIRQNARRLVEEFYSWNTLAKKYEHSLKTLARKTTS